MNSANPTKLSSKMTQLNSFILYNYCLTYQELIDDLFYQALAGNFKTEEEKKKASQDYLLYSFYIKYITECDKANLDGLDWKWLHETGRLCRFAYDNIPELKKYGYTEEDAFRILKETDNGKIFK